MQIGPGISEIMIIYGRKSALLGYRSLAHYRSLGFDKNTSPEEEEEEEEEEVASPRVIYKHDDHEATTTAICYRKKVKTADG